MKQLETLDYPRNKIIDGRVFQVPNLDFPRLLKEGVAHGVLNKCPFGIGETIYPQKYSLLNTRTTLSIGKKSYLNSVTTKGGATISIGSFSPISFGIVVYADQNANHNYRNVGSYALDNFDWRPIPINFRPPRYMCTFNIGSDVWIGQNCILKNNNPKKPLVIGDGAVIASDSVVVKNVPPYAIVGGNPAQIIKYRFPEHVIEALLRIKWWDWSLDKIHDNFQYFNDVERFVALHDK